MPDAANWRLKVMNISYNPCHIFIAFIIGIFTAIALSATNSDVSLETKASTNNIIGIVIDPKKIHLFTNYNGNECHSFKATIQCFKPDQVCLITKKPDFDYGTIQKTGQSPEEWQQLLEAGKEKSYPLHWHKNFKNLSDNDELKIVICQGDDDYREVFVSAKIRSKILAFMKLDQQAKELECYDFIKAIKFNFLHDWPLEHKDYNLWHYIEYRDQESQFLPGDAIAFYSTDDNSFSIKHFALALGNDMYLSKNGGGGPLNVSGPEALFTFWDCNHFGKLKAEACQNPHPWKNVERITKTSVVGEPVLF